MGSFWRKGSDSLKNGTIFGAVLGIAMISADKIMNFVESIIPQTWMVIPGGYSVQVYTVALLALVGYIIDRW